MNRNAYRSGDRTDRYKRNDEGKSRSTGANAGAMKGQYVARSGCEIKDSYEHKSGPNKGKQSGTPCIWGWKVATGGVGRIKFVAVSAHKPETKLDRWKKFVVTITPPNGAKFLTTGFWDIDKQRLHMPDMELIANPAKDYFGRNYKPKGR